MWTEDNWSKVLFSDESKLDLFGSDEKHYVRHSSKWGKTEPKMCTKFSEWWRRKCHGLREGFYCRSWASYTRQSECKCYLEPPAATCSSYPAFIAQSASNFHAGQCLLSQSKVGKAVP